MAEIDRVFEKMIDAPEVNHELQSLYCSI